MLAQFAAKHMNSPGRGGILLVAVVQLCTANELGAEVDNQPTPVAAVATGDATAANIVAVPDERGGRLEFSTRGKDGVVTEKMRLTNDGSFAVGSNVGPGKYATMPRGGTPGNMNVVIDDSSRPGSILMFNEHEPARGVGNTLCWYASGEGQVFLSSSWLGETRHVKQEHNRPLPWQIPSPDFPGPDSAARLEIGLRVHDWVSLAAIFEPIADDGRAFVTADREHPYLGQVQYLEPEGEWIYNRRIGRHALMIGTTHTTGATAGGVVLAGDSYHEYQGKGPVIKSPNGTAFRIVVDDNGNLSTEKFE